MPGPQETRLIQALDGARPGNVDDRAYEWSKCADILHSVSSRLDVAEMPIPAGEAGEKTAGAMNTAFKSAATGMEERATKLRDGYHALTAASQVIDDARKAHTSLGAEPSAPTYTPTDDPGSEAGIKHHNDYLAKAAAHQSEVDHRERVSREHADQIDKVLAHSSATMKEIHGEKDDKGDGGPDRPVPGGTGHAPATGHHGGGAPAVHLAGPDHGSVPGHHPGHGGDPGPGHGTDPHGPGVTYPPGTGTIGTVPVGTTIDTSTGGGLSTGTGLGLTGATVGGVGAGLVGAGLTPGGLRGILPGGAASPSTAQSAVRGIGTSSRAAGATTLGRSSVSATGATSRSGATGRSAAGGAAGANRSGTSTTRGGKAGGRAAGSTAGGRNGRRKDDDKSGKHDLFDVDEDWVDDEGAAPGVLG